MLWVDHYGNVQLNVDPCELESFDESVRLVMDGGARVARRVGTFAELDPNELGLIVDSYGLMSIVLDKHSAAEELGLTNASAVTFEQFDESRPPGVITPVQLGRRRD